MQAIKVYRWPVTQDISLQEYVDEKFKEFDSNQDGELNLIEFTKFMEELWNFSQYAMKRSCTNALSRAVGVFEQLFDWLDFYGNHEGKVDKQEMIKGVSRLMSHDIDLQDVENVMNVFDVNQDGKLERNEFVLAAMNDKMMGSVEHKHIVSTFFK